MIQNIILNCFAFVNVGKRHWLPSQVKRASVRRVFWHASTLNDTFYEKTSGKCKQSKYCFVCIFIFSFSFFISAPLTPLYLLKLHIFLHKQKVFTVCRRDQKCLRQNRNPPGRTRHLQLHYLCLYTLPKSLFHQCLDVLTSQSCKNLQFLQ